VTYKALRPGMWKPYDWPYTKGEPAPEDTSQPLKRKKLTSFKFNSKGSKMSDAIFDADAFLDATLPGSNSTRREVVPAGTYRASIDDIQVKNGTVKKEGVNFGKPWVSLNVKWSIEDDALKAQLNQTKVPIFQSIMLDLNDEGGLDMGKGRNVGLGKLREAIGLNSGPAQFRAFVGRVATIQVAHELYQGELQANVKSVAKA